MPSAFDVYIRNGSVVNGANGPAFPADIGLTGDTIAYVGPPLPPETIAGADVLDASGLTVAPGFIDIHTHADIALLASPAHLPKIMQGVTTEVFTNCGLGFAPVTENALQIQRDYLGGLFGVPSAEKQAANLSHSPTDIAQGKEVSSALSTQHSALDWNWRTVADFLAQFESQGIGANVAYLVPHGSLRVSVMGMADRIATPDEIRQMTAMLAQGLEEGAWGMSTGVWYAPMRAADRAELVALCRTAGFFATHQRDYGDGIFDATRESLDIARESGAALEIAHLQLNGEANRNRAGDILALLEQARRDGVDVTCDTYPYTAGSTLIQALLPAWATEGGPDALARRLHESESAWQIIAALAAMNNGQTDWTRYTLVGATSPTHGGQEGQTFAQAANEFRLPVPDWIVSVLQAEELRACFVHHAAHEGNVRTILQWAGQMVGSDGLHLPGKTHPRLYGTFPRVLGRYVRDEKVLSLEQAVHKMTQQPAQRLGLPNRGTIAVGQAADLALFDANIVSDTATFDDPLRFPDGIPHVFVNGVAVKRDNIPTYALPGRVLRRT